MVQSCSNGCLGAGFLRLQEGSSGGRDLKNTPLPPRDGVKCPVLNCSSLCLWRSRWNTMDTPRTHLSHLLLLLNVPPEGRRETIKPAWCYFQLPAYRTLPLHFSDGVSFCVVLRVVPRTLLFLLRHTGLFQIVRWLLLTWCDKQGWVSCPLLCSMSDTSVLLSRSGFEDEWSCCRSDWWLRVFP